MNKSIGFTLAIAGMVALAGCNGHGKVKAGLASASANPALTQAQAKVQGCVSRDGFLTHADRTNLITCLAPAGSKVALETCLQSAVSSDGLLATKADRSKFENTDAPNCVVSHG